MIGEIIGEKLEIISLLGSGASGSVYRAKYLPLNKEVAAKVMHSVQEETQLKRFQREASLLEKIDHPNVVKCYTFGTTADGQPYVVLEYLQGITLAQRLKECGKLGTEEVRSIFQQLLAGVGALHTAGIIHRDLKPSNVFMVDAPPAVSHRIKVVDFGLAKQIEGEQHTTRTGALLGTPMYMSPEQCTGQKASIASDIYSLGCILFECLLGRPPFAGDSSYSVMMSHLSEQALESGELSSSALERVLKKSLDKNPAERYQSCEEFWQELEAALSVGSKIRARTKVRVPRSVFIICGTLIAFLALSVGYQFLSKADKGDFSGVSAAFNAIEDEIQTKNYEQAATHYMALAHEWRTVPQENRERFGLLAFRIATILIDDVFEVQPVNQNSSQPAEFFPASTHIMETYVRLPPEFHEAHKLMICANYAGVMRSTRIRFKTEDTPYDLDRAHDDLMIGLQFAKNRRADTWDTYGVLWTAARAASSCAIDAHSLEGRRREHEITNGIELSDFIIENFDKSDKFRAPISHAEFARASFLDMNGKTQEALKWYNLSIADGLKGNLTESELNVVRLGKSRAEAALKTRK